MEALTLDRIQFAFTVTYHYLFPQLTMGLAPLIVVFKTLAIWKKDERWNRAARFWGKIFGITQKLLNSRFKRSCSQALRSTGACSRRSGHTRTRA